MPIKELKIPPNAVRTGDADEILRVFINADKNMDLILVTGFEEPETWGRVFSDIAYHVAHAYGDRGYNAATVLASVREAFLNEMNQQPPPLHTYKSEF